MARAVRPVKAKRKKIRIYKQSEQRGDIHISGGVARIRLTPKVILLFALMVCAAVGIVILAARQSSKQVLTAPATPRAQEGGSAPEASVTGHTDASGPPVILSVQLMPSTVTAATPLELKYAMSSTGETELSYSVRWFVNDSTVQEGSSMTLQPGMFQKGASIYAELTATDGEGRSASLATTPVTVMNTPPVLSGVTIGPQPPQRGVDLTAKADVTDMDNDTVACRYQWLVNGAPAGPESERNTFSTENLGKQDVVTVSTVCSDGQESTQRALSAPVSLGGGNGNPEIVSSAPDTVENGVYTYQVVARDPDGDTLQYRLERGVAGMTIDAASGLLQWTVPKGVMYTGRNEIQVKVTVDDGNGGTASQEFVIVLVDYVSY